MEQKSAREVQAELARPFAPEDLEWRLQQIFEDKMRGIAVPYVTNRAIQNRLDEVVGPENWYNDYKPWHGAGKKEAQICGISIFFEGRGFVTKWDGAEDSDIEPVKGGLSDSMKRAAVQWGIGRILYSMDVVFVDVERKGKTHVIKASERGKLDRAYLDMLKRFDLTPAPAGGLQSLLAPASILEPASKLEGASPKGDSENPKSRSKTAEKTTPAAEVSAPDTELTVAISPKEQQNDLISYEYIVYSAALQKGMNTQNTAVVLKRPDGRLINAFVRGVHPALRSGVRLSKTRLTMRKQDTVVFYVLEDYRIVDDPQQAA